MSEIGVIGQMYEDRRTKKRGRILERDEKFKTLLMESDDGKSFNITFGGFKSNWRKVDEPVQTVEEAMAETIPEEQIVPEKVEKKSVKKSSAKKSTTTAVTFFGNLLEKLITFSNQFNGKIVVCPNEKKFTATVKFEDGNKLFEVYSKYKIGYYNTIIKSSTVSGVSGLKDLCRIRKFSTKGVNKYNVCMMLCPEKFDEFLNIMKMYVYNTLENTIKEKEEEDK